MAAFFHQKVLLRGYNLNRQFNEDIWNCVYLGRSFPISAPPSAPMWTVWWHSSDNPIVCQVGRIILITPALMPRQPPPPTGSAPPVQTQAIVQEASPFPFSTLNELTRFSFFVWASPPPPPPHHNSFPPFEAKAYWKLSDALNFSNCITAVVLQSWQSLSIHLRRRLSHVGDYGLNK